MYYIYQRVSTDFQSFDRQESAISDYCKSNSIEVLPENIFSDKITGKTIKREEYQKMKSLLQKNDVLIMLDLDRLGRNWDIIKNEWKELTDRGIYIIIINCPLINVLPDNKGEISVDKRLIQEMMFTLLCYVSQKEVEKISMRTKEALKAKKQQGVILGRKKTISKEMEQKVCGLYCRGLNMAQIAERIGISKTSVFRIINGGKCDGQTKGVRNGK